MSADEVPVRTPSAVPVDDAVIPFEVAPLDLRGRLIKLGPTLDELLSKHDYPPPVSRLLGEAIVLTVLLGSSLKFEGRFSLQTQSDGPVSMLVVDFKWRGEEGFIRRGHVIDLDEYGEELSMLAVENERDFLSDTLIVESLERLIASSIQFSIPVAETL